MSKWVEREILPFRVEHGSKSAYDYYGCRCEECREGNRVRSRERRRKMGYKYREYERERKRREREEKKMGEYGPGNPPPPAESP